MDSDPGQKGSALGQDIGWGSGGNGEMLASLRGSPYAAPRSGRLNHRAADGQWSRCWCLGPHQLAVIRKDGIVLKLEAGEDSLNLMKCLGKAGKHVSFLK